MADESAPLIALEEGGTAPIISYNVPEPTRYAGRNFIELNFSSAYFTSKAKEVPKSDDSTSGDLYSFDKWNNVGQGLFVPGSSGGSGGDTPGTPIDPPTDDPPGGPGRIPGGLPTDPTVPDDTDTNPGTSEPTIETISLKRTTRGLSSGSQIDASGSLSLALRTRRNSVTWLKAANGTTQVVSTAPITARMAALSTSELQSFEAAGKKQVIYQTLYGELDYAVINEPTTATPRLLIVETYRLSSYLGTYGAGRTLRSFSLLPGESTTISVRTFRKSESDYQSSSSILDSFTSESSSEFESSLEQEQTSTESKEKSFEYHAEAEAKASWGWGSADVSGGVSGGTNSTREEFAKNVSSAVEKHAMTASAKREVQVETSYEVKTTEEEETSITREIKNINVGRTLNFVTRQMNQEFISILHLVDVRIAFFNGYNESKREVTLPELDSLLEEFVVEDRRTEVRQRIIDELSHIFDYRGDHYAFVEERQLTAPDGTALASYLRAKVEMTSTYRNEATGTSIIVPGIILAANSNVLRTEGVIVEALLGQGDALDTYSHGLQDQSVRAKTLENDQKDAEIAKIKLGLTIAEAGDAAKGAVYDTVFGEPSDEESGGE